jgi:nitric oxide reductase large subunit
MTRILKHMKRRDLVIILLVYLLTTSQGAVRLSMAIHGHPIAAATCRITKLNGKNNHYFVHSMPMEIDGTGATLSTYQVKPLLVGMKVATYYFEN